MSQFLASPFFFLLLPLLSPETGRAQSSRNSLACVSPSSYLVRVRPTLQYPRHIPMPIKKAPGKALEQTGKRLAKLKLCAYHSPSIVIQPIIIAGNIPLTLATALHESFRLS